MILAKYFFCIPCYVQAKVTSSNLSPLRIVGVSFAMPEEASAFHGKVQDLISRKEYHLRPSTIKKAWAKFSTFTSKTRKGANASASSNSNNNTNPSSSVSAKSDAASASNKKKASDKAKEKDLVISSPVNFRVDLHIGPDADGKFGIQVRPDCETSIQLQQGVCKSLNSIDAGGNQAADAKAWLSMNPSWLTVYLRNAQFDDY
jgi:hypothetical protein